MVNTDVLRSLGLFSDSAAAHLLPVAAASQQLGFPRGTALYAEGRPTPSLLGILRGRVKITCMGLQVPVFLELSGPGELLGLSSALRRSACAASAETVERCALIRIPVGAFQRWYREEPLAKDAVALILAVRDESRASHELRRHQDVLGRTCGYLLDYTLGENFLDPAEAVRIRLRFTLPRGDLGEMVGTHPTNISHVLKVLENQGLIERLPDSILIRNEQGLRDLSKRS